MTLSKVGAIESSEATELLTSSLNGYKIEAQKAMSVVDKISSIDLAAATSSYELATALARTANSANDAGVSFDKLLAMIGTVSSVTRKSASTIGESFKTIFARMSNVAAGKDTDDEGESLNDVEKTLNRMGIALRSAQGEWRSFEDVLDEVAAKWNNGTFNEIEQSQIATAIAGVRQQENFRALMNNYDEVGRLAQVAADSTGSASERMKIYLDSVEAKTNNLKNAWEGFIMSLNQSESYKEFLDWLTNVVETLQFVDWRIVGIVAGAGSLITIILKLIPAIKTLITTIKTAGIAAGIASGGIVPLLGIVLTLITSIATAWSTANSNLDGQIEKIQKNKEELETEKDTVESLVDTYNNLKAKNDIYGLSTEEKQKLLDVSTELVKTYGFEYDGIDNLTGAYNIGAQALSNYNEKLKEQQELYSIEEQKTRRKKIDERLDYLDGRDGEFLTAEKNREMGQDFDKELYYSYSKERESIITEIQEQMSTLFSEDISQGTKNLILEQIAKDAGEMTATEIGTRYTDEYLAKLNDFSEKNNSIINQVFQTQKKYEDLINKNGVLSLDNVDKYKQVLEDRLAIYKQMQNEGLISQEEFNQQAIQMENEVSNRLDFSLKVISENLGENNGKFNALAGSVLSLTTELKQGKKTLGEYSQGLANLTKNLDIKDVFGENTEAATLFFTTISNQLTNVLSLIKSNYDSGLYDSNNAYLNDIISWGESFSLISNKMKSFREETNETTKAVTEQQGKIATIRNQNLYSYVMPKEEFDRQQKIQAKVAEIRSNWESFEQSGGDVSSFTDSSTELAMKSKARDNEKQYGTYGISQQDYFDYIKSRVDYGEEAVKRYQEIYNEAQKIENESERQEFWNKETNKYTEENTNITNYAEYYENQISQLKNKKSELQNELDDIAKKSIVSLENNESYQETQEEIDKVTKEVEDYENKLKSLDKEQDSFEKTVEKTNAAIEGQTEETEDSAQEVVNYIKNLKDLQDSVSAMEKINSGEIVPDTEEYTNALTTIITDITSQMKDASGNIKSEIKGIFGETSVMYTGTMQEILTAYQNGEISLEQFQSALQATVQSNINGLKNAVGDFLIELGNAFNDFEVTLKITMNTGNILDKLQNALAGVTGGEQNLGEIKVSSDAIKNTLSTLGNAIKSVPLEFDFQYTPNSSSPIGGKTSPSGSTLSGGGTSGSGYSAEDAAEDLADILEDIKDYEADIELDLEDQTEQLINHYNLEKNKLDSLKEELDYYEGIYDSVEDTTKWLETQEKLLENQSKTVAELQKSNDKINKQREKIYKENSKYKISGWFDSEGNDTLAYGDLINSFEYQINAIQKETAKKMRNVYNSVSGSRSETAIENAKDRIEELEKEADRRIEALEKEREKVENIHDSVSELNDAWDENQEAIRDALADMHDRIIDIRDTLVDQLMEQLEKAVDKQNESIEKDVTRMEQLVSIREKYYEILNETIDTQADLDSELQSSLDSFEYLDEQMRQLMFNEEDYKALSETLTGIQEDIAGIWEDHYNKIDSLTDDEMYKAEYITAETERQLDMKMKEYELAKAELDVAKAKTNLQNVQNERNVRMFVNGQWTWVADPDAVKDAQKQLADAEREKDRIEREQEQQKLIDKMEGMIDSDNLQIDENNELLERVQEAIEAQTQEVQSIEDALQNIKDTNLPALNDVLVGAFGSDGKGGFISELLANINKSTSLLTLSLKGYTTASAEKALKSGNLSKAEFEDLVESLGYSFNSTTGKVTTLDGSFSAHYKGWKKQSNSDTQLGTAGNGVQVTGNGSSGGTSSGGSKTNGFPRTGHVSTGSLPLRIRSGAGTNYKVLGLMPKGAKVTITGEANSGWAKVRYNGINGYASRQYLTYDQGGLATGKGVFLKDINVPERVLSPKQTKSFDYLVKNLTTNPVLAALTKNPNIKSNLSGLGKAIGETKQYYFSNFTVQADNLTEFIDSLDAMIPISRK